MLLTARENHERANEKHVIKIATGFVREQVENRGKNIVCKWTKELWLHNEESVKRTRKSHISQSAGKTVDQQTTTVSSLSIRM